MGKCNFKRILSLLLALVTVFLLCPAGTAVAETATLTACPHCGGELGALTYTSWNGTVEYTENDAHYRLTADAALAGQITVPAGANLVLDLAGYSLTAAAGSRCFTVSGTLTVLDSSGSTGKLMGSDVSIHGRGAAGYGGTIYVTEGTLNLLSGTVTGGTAIYGGNIYCTRGALNIYGGTVSKGTAVNAEMSDPETLNNTGRGGNIYLYASAATIGGDARILDGTAWYLSDNSGRGGNLFATSSTDVVICGNAILAGGYARQRGGNVALNSRTTLTLRDNATIYGGSARSHSNNVDVMTSTLTVEGGTIYGSPAGGCTNNIDVYSTDSQFNFTGGKVYGRIGALVGMTINVSGKPYIEHLYLPEGALVTPSELEDGAWIGVEAEKSQHITVPLPDPGYYMYFFNYQKTGLTWYDRKGGTNALLLTAGTPCQCCGEDVYDIIRAGRCITINQDTFAEAPLTMVAGHYQLAEDVDLNSIASPITVDGTAGYVTLDLNGFTLTGPDGQRVFDFAGGTLNIVDTSASKDGKITSGGAYDGNGGVIALTNEGSALNLYGGTLTGAVSGYSHYGGTVYVSDGNTLNIYGGFIDSGTSQGHGGNIFANDGAVVNLYDGTVSGGQVTGGTKEDGTAFVGAGGNIYITGLDTTLNLYGGIVTDGVNYVSTGGNIQVNSGAQMRMYAGEVTYGSALKSAGNIYLSSSRSGRYSSFEMYGGTVGAIDDIVASVKSLNRGSANNPLVIYNGTVLDQDVTAYMAPCACYAVAGTETTVWNYGHNENVCDNDCPMEQAWGKAYVKTLQTGQHDYRESTEQTCACSLCSYTYPGQAAAVANGKTYASITDAVADTTDGTVVMLGDATVGELSVSGITLDLNGYTLTAEAFSSAASGNVADTSGGNGKLVCDSVTLAENNTYLPVTLDDGIHFCEVGFTQWLERVDETTTKVKFYFTQRSNETLIDNAIRAGNRELAVQIRLTWTNSEGVKQDKTYAFGPELLQKYTEKWNGRVFVTTIGGVDAVTDLTCTYQVTSTAASGTTVCAVTLNNVAHMNQKLTWDAINSYPLKTADMTVEEMRQLCINFFEYSKSALWTPDESVDYIKNKGGSKDNMSQGTVYGDLPYVSYGTGNIYRLMDFIDPATGLVDMKKAIPALGTKDLLEVSDMRYFGNQCANSAYVGWGRVINSVFYSRTYDMVPANGYIFLGNVEFDRTIARWTTSYTTKEVCKDNGQQVLFAAYAQLQKADGLVYYTTAGHVIMAVTDAHVVYNSDGTINGDKSYIYITEQAQTWKSGENDTGDSYQYKASVNSKKTFTSLFNTNYIPFTYKEFLGTDPVDVTQVSLVGSDDTVYTAGIVDETSREFVGTQTADTLTWSELFSSVVTANYGIADAYIIVTDAGGNELYKHAVRTTVTGNLDLELAEAGANVTTWETKPLFPGRTYNVSIEVQLYTGERPTIYNGQLTI